MTIKALLIGSTAALIAVSGARAADAIIADAEPMDYVKVCDAYGAGFFYIPGTETCLKIGGFVRYDINISEGDDGDYGWTKNTRGVVNVDAREDTEFGTLRGFISLQGNSSDGADINDGTTGRNVRIDEAYLSLGGFYAGLRFDYFDGNGIGGENDSSAGQRVNAVGYDFTGNGFSAGIMLADDDNDAINRDFTPNVQGFVSASFGPANMTVVAGYDNDTEEGLVEATAKFAVAEGVSFDVLGIYASGATTFWDTAEWSVGASVNAQLSDTVLISVGAQYADKLAFVDNASGYTVGANLDWTPVNNFLVRGTVQYGSAEINGVDVDETTAQIRFQRSF